MLRDAEIREIADRLKRARLAISPSQTAFARGAGLSQHRYNQYETAARPLTLDAATKICRAYGLSLDWLFYGDSAMLPHAIAELLAKRHIPER